MGVRAWHCQGPNHVGERLIANPYHRFSKRITFMRADGKRRVNEHVVQDPNRCLACAMMSEDPEEELQMELDL